MWLRYALNITTKRSNSYYTAIDPGEFYEWKFSGYIPKGKIFTKGLPSSDIFTKGLIIATAKIPSSQLDQKEFGLETNCLVPADIVIQAGQIPSPQELLDRFIRAQTAFQYSVDEFKKSASIRSYFKTNNALYRITMDNSGLPQLCYYGSIKDISDQLSVIRKSLSKDSLIKKGKSLEMEDFRRFENAMTFIQNDHLPIDTKKIDTLLRIAEIKPKTTSSSDWQNCLLVVSEDARKTFALLQRYQSLNWVREMSSFLSKKLDGSKTSQQKDTTKQFCKDL